MINGFGKLTADGAVAVDDGESLRGKATIITTGSVPRAIPGMEHRRRHGDHLRPATNSDADRLPERVAVIGGGVIGAEFASVYTDLGV